MNIQFKETTIDVQTSDSEIILVTGTVKEIRKTLETLEATRAEGVFVDSLTGQSRIRITYTTELNSEEAVHKLNRVSLFG